MPIHFSMHCPVEEIIEVTGVWLRATGARAVLTLCRDRINFMSKTIVSGVPDNQTIVISIGNCRPSIDRCAGIDHTCRTKPGYGISLGRISLGRIGLWCSSHNTGSVILPTVSIAIRVNSR